MTQAESVRPRVFSIRCPYLRKTVHLYRDTWNYKILRDHPEVRNCGLFISKAMIELDEDSNIFRKRKDADSVAIFTKCHLLEPLYKYLKIALRFVSDQDAVITTAHGSNNNSAVGMERL
jgi:hypothetical protein